MNVIHIHDTAMGAASGDVFEALQDAVTAAMWDQLSSGASVTQVDITPLNGTSATTSFLTGSGAVWTGGSGGVTAPAVSPIVKLQSGIRGRANRGRVFLPFMVGAAVDDGFLAGAEATSMTAAWEAFRGALQSDPDGAVHLAIASYDRRHAGVGAHVTDVIACVVERPLGTQRRRQGRNRGA